LRNGSCLCSSPRRVRAVRHVGQLTCMKPELHLCALAHSHLPLASAICGHRCVDLLHGRTSVVLRSTGSASNKGSLQFHGLREVTVRTRDQIFSEIERGKAARTVGSNYRHDYSSRAHTIVRLRVEAARLVTVGGGAADGGDKETLTDTSAGVLTLVDLAGSEAASLNSTQLRVSQGIAINKSLHWLKVAVHDLAAKKPVVPFRNSAITRLLQPSLAGQAVVAVLVTAPILPGSAAGRDTLDALMFGVEVAKLKLTPTQNTQVDAAGQVGKLQNLLVQMADDKAALASDAEVLREQLLSYQALFEDFRRDFVSAESLKEAKRNAAAELASALERSSALESQLEEEQAAKEALKQQLEAVGSEAAAVARRNAELESRVHEAVGGRHALEARLAELKMSLEESRAAASAQEAELAKQRHAEAQLRAQIEALSAREQERREAAERAEAQADALAAENAETMRQLEMLSEEKRSLETVAQAKGDLLMLKSKLYRSRSAQNRPGSASARLGSLSSCPSPGYATSPSSMRRACSSSYGVSASPCSSTGFSASAMMSPAPASPVDAASWGNAPRREHSAGDLRALDGSGRIDEVGIGYTSMGQ